MNDTAGTTLQPVEEQPLPTSAIVREWIALLAGGLTVAPGLRWTAWARAVFAMAVIVSGWGAAVVLTDSSESASANTATVEAMRQAPVQESLPATAPFRTQTALFGAPRTPDQQPGVAAPGAILAQLSQELQLVAVLGSDPPRAAIMLRSTKQTHTVAVGQRIGEFEVEAILPTKVLLQWHGQRVELGL